MARCRQTSSHYLNQCWLRYMQLYSFSTSQWVNVMISTFQQLIRDVTLWINFLSAFYHRHLSNVFETTRASYSNTPIFPRSKFWRHLIRNAIVILQGDVFENVVCKMSATLVRFQYVTISRSRWHILFYGWGNGYRCHGCSYAARLSVAKTGSIGCMNNCLV